MFEREREVVTPAPYQTECEHLFLNMPVYTSKTQGFLIEFGDGVSGGLLIPRTQNTHNNMSIAEVFGQGGKHVRTLPTRFPGATLELALPPTPRVNENPASIARTSMFIAKQGLLHNCFVTEVLSFDVDHATHANLPGTSLVPTLDSL